MKAVYITDWETQVTLTSRHMDIVPSGKVRGESPVRMPLAEVNRMLVIGRSRVSMRVVEQLMNLDIPVYLFSRTGNLLGSFSPNRDGDAHMRIRQYREESGAWSGRAAARLVNAKLSNSRRVLQKLAASYTPTGPADGLEIKPVLDDLQQRSREAANCTDLESLRGIEGAGSRLYFSILKGFYPASMPFEGRNRRPPKDPVNALLSWTYSIVLGEVKAAITAHGLDPCIGVLHSLSYNRPSLALDLLEPFRAPLCDLLVLRLVKLNLLQPSDFEKDEATDGIRMKKPAMKRFFEEYEKRMNRPFKNRETSKEVCFRSVIQEQASRYANALCKGQEFIPFGMP